MANIQMNDALYQALIQRMRIEHGDALLVNYTQDIVIEGLLAEKQKFTEHNAALIEANTKLREENELLKSNGTHRARRK